MNFRDETRLEFVNVENKFKDSEVDEENTWKTVKYYDLATKTHNSQSR